MSAKFVDSNVLIYLFDKSDERKRAIAADLFLEGITTRTAAISFQVVQEVLNVLTTKLTPCPPVVDVQDFLNRTLLPLWKVMPSASLYQRALNVQQRYRYGFYDSLIVSAALEAGCTILYSEDLHAGQKIEKLIIQNPF